MSEKIKMPPAVILAGGKGERLRPLTATNPKPLLPVGGVPVIIHILDLLDRHGVKDVLIAAGYMGDKLRNAVGSKYGSIKIDYYIENEPLGTAGCVKAVAGRLGNEFIVMCGDAFCDINLSDAVKYHREKEAVATLVLTKVTDPLEYGMAMTSSDGKITGFSEKPSWTGVFTETANTGIYVLDSSVLERIPSGKYDFGRDLFGTLVAAGERVYGFISNDPWCDIGDIKSYYNCNMRQTGGKNAIGNQCSIARDSKITKSVIFDRVMVGEGSRIEGAVICEDSVIGEFAEIGRGCVIGAGSVISNGVKLGSGRTLSDGTVIAARTVIESDNTSELKFGERALIVPGEKIDEILCEKIGAACACALEGEPVIAVMCGEGEKCDTVKNALLRGISGAGKTAADAGIGFYSLACFAAREGAYDLTVCAEAQKTGQIRLTFFDKYGFYPDSRFERSVEKGMRCSEKKKSTAGEIVEAGNIIPKYTDYLISSSEVRLDGIKIKCEDDFASGLVFEALKKLGVSTIDNEGNKDIENEENTITIHLKDGGRTVSISQGGTTLDFWHIVATVAGEAVRKGTTVIALPYRTPDSVKKMIISAGAKLRNFSLSPSDGSERLTRELAALMPWMFDGCAASVRICGIIKKSGQDINRIAEKLPMFGLAEGATDSGEDDRAYVLSHIGEPAGEGVRINGDRGSVRVIARRDRGFTLMAEAAEESAASDLIRLAEMKIAQARAEKNSEKYSST